MEVAFVYLKDFIRNSNFDYEIIHKATKFQVSEMELKKLKSLFKKDPHGKVLFFRDVDNMSSSGFQMKLLPKIPGQSLEDHATITDCNVEEETDDDYNETNQNRVVNESFCVIDKGRCDTDEFIDHVNILPHHSESVPEEESFSSDETIKQESEFSGRSSEKSENSQDVNDEFDDS